MSEWATVAEIGTAAGTLVLAVATFASVRSANAAARVAQQSLLESRRPILLSSRLDDPAEKVGFSDDHWFRMPGGHGHAEVTDDAIYLAIAVRNVGNGLAVLNSWSLTPRRQIGQGPAPDLADFRRLTRDLYIAAGETGFWQGAFRDPAEPDFTDAAKPITARETFDIDILYSDGSGGQRMITRFAMVPAHDDDAWITSVSHHWNLDRPDPVSAAPAAEG